MEIPYFSKLWNWNGYCMQHSGHRTVVSKENGQTRHVSRNRDAFAGILTTATVGHYCTAL